MAGGLIRRPSLIHACRSAHISPEAERPKVKVKFMRTWQLSSFYVLYDRPTDLALGYGLLELGEELCDYVWSSTSMS